MTQRAAIRQADLNRALKAAAKAGFAVEVQGDTIRFLPNDPGAPLPSPDAASAALERAMGKWRRSA